MSRSMKCVLNILMPTYNRNSNWPLIKWVFGLIRQVTQLRDISLCVICSTPNFDWYSSFGTIDTGYSWKQNDQLFNLSWAELNPSPENHIRYSYQELRTNHLYALSYKVICRIVCWKRKKTIAKFQTRETSSTIYCNWSKCYTIYLPHPWNITKIYTSRYNYNYVLSHLKY